MKKLIALLIILLMMFLYPKQKETIMTFLELDDSYHIYDITMDNLNTKNIMDYFNDDTILFIMPSINKIYMHEEIKYPFNTEKSITYNINNFKEYYLSLVDNYYGEKEKYILNGIPIKKITIYMSSERLKELLNEGFKLIS